MPRAIITAAVGRDLFAEVGGCVAIPGATNGVLQAFDTNDRDRFSGVANITVYTTRASVPAALRPYLVAVLRSDSPTVPTNTRYVRYADLGASDYFRVVNSGVTSTKLKSAVVAGDRPVDWVQVHGWLGIPDDELGDNG